MNLYLISQETNNDYDTFDSAVVCAPDELAARNMHPSGECESATECELEIRRGSWCAPEHVMVQYLGKATKGLKQGVVLASFNAG